MIDVTDQMRELAEDVLALIDSDQQVSPSVLEGNARRLAELVLAHEDAS